MSRQSSATPPLDYIDSSAPDSPPSLRGSRCSNCAEVLFPATKDCPLCMATDSMRPHLLRGHGILRDYTVAERGPTGFDVPYVQAWVKLDDGPVVFAPIAVPDPAVPDLTVGQAVTMSVGPVGTATSELLGWRFCPDGESV
jgi:uncharacterized OB-fold protein